MQESRTNRRTVLLGAGTALFLLPGVTEAQEGANFKMSVTHTPDIVAEGESGVFAAEITNTGNETDVQTIELTVSRDGEELTSREVTVPIDPGESVSQSRTFEYDDYGGPGKYVGEGCSEDDCDTAEWAVVSADGPAFFEVEIIEVTETAAGEVLSVDVSVSNRGGETDSQEITLAVDGLGSVSTTVELDGQESTTEVLSVPTEPGDAGDYTATVASEDYSDETAVTVVSPAYFTVDIEETNAPVFEDETLTVDAMIENTGGTSDTSSLSLTVGGDERDVTSVTLDSGDSTTVTLEWETEPGDAGEYTATIASEDEDVSTDVTVQGPASFDPEITDTNSPVVESDLLSVTTTVTNTGDAEATQTLSLSVAGEQRDTTNVSLSGGDSTTVTLEWETEPGDAGEYTATVTSDDGSDSTSVTINSPPTLVVDINGTNAPVVAGESFTVEAVAENTGDAPATQAVSLSIAGEQRDSTTVSLDGGDSTTVTLEWETEPGDAGEYTATVTSDDGSDTTSVTVNSPPTLVVDISGTNAPVVAGESFTVEAAVENTGDVAATQAVSLSIAGEQRDTTTVSLDGGDSTTVTLEWETGDDDAGEYTATVASEDDTATTDVSVHEPSNITVEITDTNSPVVESETLHTTTAVENTGDVAATQAVSLSIAGEQRDSTTVSLDGGDSTTVTLEWETGDGDAGEYTAVVVTGETTAETLVNVTADGRPQPIIGEDPPKDRNGDGLYRDINGDGEFTITDVQVFFENRDSDVVQNNPGAFNFDGTDDPEEVTLADVQALFMDLRD
jgi:hypothetical protein